MNAVFLFGPERSMILAFLGFLLYNEELDSDGLNLLRKGTNVLTRLVV